MFRIVDSDEYGVVSVDKQAWLYGNLLGHSSLEMASTG